MHLSLSSHQPETTVYPLPPTSLHHNLPSTSLSLPATGARYSHSCLLCLNRGAGQYLTSHDLIILSQCPGAESVVEEKAGLK
ncbi:hypothetical protein Pmani_014825 [Petrolisthes manimaculis]|uniref:Uncharacterized protein n=1 Tax=Petrolisthes manimaculis TaxID=1843537 RepID=A0AAE1PS61_9EUCA|nr:hypothetical protein Pmani_014825 [Petrolisthes manimaculis]